MNNDELSFIDNNGIKHEDKLHLQNILIDFTDFIRGTDYHVFGVNGGWGTGKTYFIQLWKNSLPEEVMGKDEIGKKNCIFLDAFECDYETSPYIMIISGINKFLLEHTELNTSIGEKFRTAAKDMISVLPNALGKAVIGFISQKMGSDATHDIMKDFAGTVFDRFCPASEEDEDTTEKIHKQLKDAITKITEKQKIIIIIDDLDRCRPDFALETLEKIKHFFSIGNLYFILVYDEKSLGAMIKTRYGIEENPERYLTKFIDSVYDWAEKNKDFENIWLQDILQRVNPPLFRKISSDSDYSDYIYTILSIKHKYNIGYRDFEKIFQYEQVPFQVSGNNIYIALLILKYINKNEYESLLKYIETEDSTWEKYNKESEFQNIIDAMYANKNAANEYMSKQFPRLKKSLLYNNIRIKEFHKL